MYPGLISDLHALGYRLSFACVTHAHFEDFVVLDFSQVIEKAKSSFDPPPPKKPTLTFAICNSIAHQ